MSLTQNIYITVDVYLPWFSFPEYVTQVHDCLHRSRSDSCRIEGCALSVIDSYWTRINTPHCTASRPLLDNAHAFITFLTVSSRHEPCYWYKQWYLIMTETFLIYFPSTRRYSNQWGPSSSSTRLTNQITVYCHLQANYCNQILFSFNLKTNFFQDY